jgi:outer membrane protein assembly factor BamB
LQAPWPEEGLPILWEKEVGTGYSAPSVRGNRLVLHHRLQKEEIVVCFAADTGAELWKYAYPSDFRDPYGYNNGPRCSPLLTKDRCYTFGAEGKLLCLDLETGKQIWIRDTAADWNIPEAFFGVGSTPILEGKLLIVMVGGQPRAGIVAFHADTGETAWEAVGKGIWKFPQAGYQIDDKLASYSSLLGATINGKRHVLALMRDGLVSVTPHTGRVNFSYFFRSRMFESVNAARPVVVGNQIFLSAAYRAGAALLKVETDGDNVTELWKNNKLETHWSTTIAHAGYLYGFSGRHEPEGTLRCLDLKTGEVQWETEGAGDDVPFSPKDGLGATEGRYYGRGSAILADGHFIVLGERGVLALVEANPKEFKEISRFKYPQMNYPSWAAPVLSRQRLYLRDENNLLCLDLAKPAPKKKPSTP